MRRYLLRTRFGDIVAEFLPPARPSRKVIIFCQGMPGNPSRASLAEFFARKGFWFFAPRYRGSWESGGKFLKISPEKDILRVISQLPRGFHDLYAGKVYKVKPSQLCLCGASFGGPAVLLLTKDPRVSKVIAVSPVVDWTVPVRRERADRVEKFVKQAFGEAYRFSHRDWRKLDSGKFYNPASMLEKIDGGRYLLFTQKMIASRRSLQ